MVQQKENQAQRTVNGVDVGALSEKVEMLKAQPELGRFQFRATNEWVSDSHCRTTVKDFYGAGQEDTTRTEPFIFDADEPPVLLGANRGANPVEYALTALAGCLMTSLVMHAAARGIEIKRVESQLEGDLDVRGFLGIAPEVRNGYQNIRVNFKIDSDASEEQLKELCEVAQQRSPVYDIVTNAVPIEVTMEPKMKAAAAE